MPLRNQFHEVWGVMDHTGTTWNVELGVGLGVTAGSDRITLKLMISRDLNSRAKKGSDSRSVTAVSRTRGQ